MKDKTIFCHNILFISNPFDFYQWGSSQVIVAGDYRSVNVYWMASKSEDDSQLEELLQSISGPLRHELSRLRIMGEIPKIQFVKGNVRFISMLKSLKIKTLIILL